jgi:hypothetical protein
VAQFPFPDSGAPDDNFGVEFMPEKAKADRMWPNPKPRNAVELR